MKVSLNERTTQKVVKLLEHFPEGTKLTHIINLALSELETKLIMPNKAENTDDSGKPDPDRR